MAAARKDDIGTAGKIALGVAVTTMGVVIGGLVVNYAWMKYATYKAKKAASLGSQQQSASPQTAGGLSAVV